MIFRVEFDAGVKVPAEDHDARKRCLHRLADVAVIGAGIDDEGGLLCTLDPPAIPSLYDDWLK